jgi:hypothetical protein
VARPFQVGDHIRVRAGALGGIFDAWVWEMSLTYVTLHTEEGLLKIPNSAMLAAGIGQLPADNPPGGPTAGPRGRELETLRGDAVPEGGPNKAQGA